MNTDDVPDVEEPYYEIERILRWQKVKEIKRFKRIFSTMEEIPNRRGNLGPSTAVQPPRTTERLFK